MRHLEPHTGGGPQGSLGQKKGFFPNLFVDHLGDQTSVFSPFRTHGDAFWPVEVPKCLENGPFSVQEWVQNRSETRFSTSEPGLFGVRKQVKPSHFEPVLSNFGPSKVVKSLGNGPFWDHRWVEYESKMRWGCPPSQAVASGRKRLQGLEMPFFGQNPPFEGSMQVYYGL